MKRNSITSLASMLAVSALLCCLGLAVPPRAAAAAATPVIIDTDIFSSADDVGALATAFSLQHLGEANVIAITLNTRTSRPVVAVDSLKCVAAIENFYGSSAPIGTQTVLGDPQPNDPNFIGPCGQLAPVGVSPSGNAVSVMTQALTAQADHSVVIVTTGYESNLANFLEAPGGSDLVARKVSKLVVMGGGYALQPDGTLTSPEENNFNGDIAGAQYVAANWPTEVVYSGAEVGDAVETGGGISASHPDYSPVRVAYEAFVGKNNWIYSHDLTAMYEAIRPNTLLKENGPGTNVVTDRFDPKTGWDYGANVFTMDPAGHDYYLTVPDPIALDNSLNSLLDYVPPLPPSTSIGPLIAGGAMEGQALVESHAPWSGTPSGYEYQWQSCDGLGNNCSAIAGATVQTYTLTAADVGHTIRVQEVATSAGVDSSPAVSAQTTTVLPLPPTNTALPTISGPAVDGQTLRALVGNWTNSPTAYVYQWERCDATGGACADIPGAAAAAAYVLTPVDMAHTIRVQEIATNAGGDGSPATSAPTAVVTAPASPTPPAAGPLPPSGPGPAGPAPVSTATIRAMLTKAMAVQGSASKLRAVLKQGGYSFSATAPSAGCLVISWYTQNRGKKVVVAKVTFTFIRAGAKKVKIALTASGRKLVRANSRMTITVNAAFAPSHEGTTSMTKKLILRW
jgi:hypothetical protein